MTADKNIEVRFCTLGTTDKHRRTTPIGSSDLITNPETPANLVYINVLKEKTNKLS